MQVNKEALHERVRPTRPEAKTLVSFSRNKSGPEPTFIDADTPEDILIMKISAQRGASRTWRIATQTPLLPSDKSMQRNTGPRLLHKDYVHVARQGDKLTPLSGLHIRSYHGGLEAIKQGMPKRRGAFAITPGEEAQMPQMGYTAAIQTSSRCSRQPIVGFTGLPQKLPVNLKASHIYPRSLTASGNKRRRPAGKRACP